MMVSGMEPGTIVEVYKYEKKPKAKQPTKEFDYKARFVTFGIDYEGHVDYAGHYPVAIVKKNDGFLEAVPVQLVKVEGFSANEKVGE